LAIVAGSGIPERTDTGGAGGAAGRGAETGTYEGVAAGAYEAVAGTCVTVVAPMTGADIVVAPTVVIGPWTTLAPAKAVDICTLWKLMKWKTLLWI